MSACSVLGCDRPVLARGWCNRCYTRWRKHGDPLVTLVSPRDASIDDRLERYTQREGECLVWIGDRRGLGYGRVTIKGQTHAVHRLVWERTNGPIPDGLWVLHHCDNPPCCEPKHLFLGTPKDNSDDMIGKGRRHVTRGSTHPMAKLTPADVVEIRRLSQRGMTYPQIAAVKNVSRSTVWRAVRRAHTGDLQ